jgi:broad specificity phosphatase PhoE
VFNVGNYRRQEVGAKQSAEFFDPHNKEAMARRRTCAIKALEDMVKFLTQDNGHAAVFDATNSTRDRRQLVIDTCKARNIKLMFLELICDNVEIVEENIKEVKVSSPDYVGFDPDAAIEDFKERIRKYTDAYEPLDSVLDKEFTWLKVYNVDERYEANRIEGHLQAKLVYYMMNIHTRPRNIYLTRHGESMLNVKGKIGGNSDLSERGQKYALALKDFLKKEAIKDMKVWTSHLKRTIQTAAHLNVPVEQWHALNEIDAGECEAMSYEEIQSVYPKEFAYRDQDKFHYRYPRGESYQDLVHRLEPVIMELERQKNVLVICHQAVMRCILAYFLNKTTGELPYIECPLHTVVKLTPQAYGCKMEKFPLDIPAVDTYRPKPKVVNLKRSDSEALQNLPEHF